MPVADQRFQSVTEHAPWSPRFDRGWRANRVYNVPLDCSGGDRGTLYTWGVINVPS